MLEDDKCYQKKKKLSKISGPGVIRGTLCYTGHNRGFCEETLERDAQ